MSEESPIDMRQIQVLVTQIDAAKEAIKKAEEHLAAEKAALKGLEEEGLPDLMEELNLRRITMADGREVTVGEYYNASASRTKEEGGGPNPAALAWLREHGHGDIIKAEVIVNVGRDEELRARVQEQLRSMGVEPTFKEAVHPSTLRAWVKEQINNHQEVDYDVFRIYVGRKAKIK